MNRLYHEVCKRCYKDNDNVCWALYSELKEQFIQVRGGTSTSTSATTTLTFVVGNLASLIINFGIAGVLLTNTVEEAVPLNLDKVLLDLNAPFVYGLTHDNIIGDLGASCHSFNNLKWF